MKKNTNELITVKEASAILEEKTEKIYKAIRRKELDVFGDGIIKLSKKQVEDYRQGKITAKSLYSSYGDIALDFDESLKPVESYHNNNSMKSPLKFKSKCQYAVSNKGRVFNLSRNYELSQNPAAHGYLQTDLTLNRKEIHIRVHVLIAYAWCPNSKFKNEVHHIDGNKLNNFANNLIWMSMQEHTKAHRLMDEAKQTNDWSSYNQYISKIQEDNKWYEEYRCVAFEKENAIIFVWISKAAYDDYRKGIRTLDQIYWYEVKAQILTSKQL